MVKRVFLFLCLSLLAVTGWAANITTQVDRDPVRINESFKIIFEADDDVSASPDFSPLEQDFEILSRSRSSNMQILNGDMTQQTRWTLFVMAKRSGKLTIPSIAVGNDRSPQISVTVKEKSDTGSAASENMEMFIEAEAQPSTAYVQSQIIYTVRFYRAVNVSGAGMSEPSFGGAEVVAQQLGEDSAFETQRNGRRYIVIERKYALFPQQSGDITIDPISLDAQVVTRRPGVFDPFGQNTTTRRLKSKSITLDVRPIPNNMQNRPWLPATEVRLSENWSQQPPQFVVGEPITRTLTLKAEGLTAAQLPSLRMQENDDFKTYPDQPRLNDKRGRNGISGTRQEKIAIVPTRAGELTLPEIEIPWFNTNTHQVEIARVPARTVQVRAAAGGAVTPTPQATSKQPADEQTETVHATSEPAADTTPAAEKQQSGIYVWLSLGLGLGWLATAVAWFINSRKQKPSHRQPNRTAVSNASLNAVKQACRNNDAQQCKTALLNWANSHWPDDSPTNLGEIGRRLGSQTQQEIEQLNQALYGQGANNWRGETLWQALKDNYKNGKSQTHNGQRQPLRPLYP